MPGASRDVAPDSRGTGAAQEDVGLVRVLDVEPLDHHARSIENPEAEVVTVGVHHHGGAASTTIGARLVLSVDADVVRRYGHLLKIRARAHEHAIARGGRIHGSLDARELRV